MSRGILARLRLSSLRLRLVVVFALVALTAAVAASGIAYWLNREAVLTRTQDGALNDFRQEMQNRVATLPLRPGQEELRRTAEQMASGSAGYQVLLLGERDEGKPIVGASDPDDFTLADVPRPLRDAVDTRRPVTDANPYPYHLFWQRTERGGTPYLVGGTRIDGGGPAGYMFKSLAAEKADLNSLAWSLGIGTALGGGGWVGVGQVAAANVLRAVQRRGVAGPQLGVG
ncbi:two-component sensor histidine kinase, partial [Streptomyces sp. NPDC058861]